MRALKYSPLLLALVWSAYGNTAGAATTVIGCHNCSYGQYKQQAIAAVPTNGQRTLVYVVDRSNKRLAKYSITIENSEGMTYNRVRTLNPSPQDLVTFNADINELDEFAVEALAGTELPGYFPIKSASEIYNNNQALVQVQGWINDQILTREFLVLSYLFGSKLLENYTADIKVVFPDGSSAVFHVFRLEFAVFAVKVSLRYTPDTAVGPEGNTLPDTSEDLPGYQAEFYFTTSVQAFLNRMRLLGIPVVIPAGGGLTRCEFVGNSMICRLMRH